MAAPKTWFYIGVGYKTLDIITTIYLVFKEGKRVESSPFVLDMMYAYGIIPGLIINGIIVGMLLYILYKYKEKDLLALSVFLLMIPVILNTLKILGL